MYKSNHSIRFGFAVLMTVLLSFLALGGSDAVAQGMEAMKGTEGMASSRHASAQVVDVSVMPPTSRRRSAAVRQQP